MNALRIVLTGATGGIGAALVRAYAAPGVSLLLFGRDEARLDAVRQVADAAGAEVKTHRLDVQDGEGFAQAVAEFAAAGTIDLAILAAGVKTGNQRGVEPSGQAARVLDVNLKSVVAQTEILIPLMRERGRGQIALFSSIAALAPQPDLLSYSASKAALRAYGVGLRRALRGSGVTVHVISPGFIDTPMTDRHHGRTPMKLSAEQAASKIRSGLKKRTAFISFPLGLVFLVRLQNLLPVALSDWIDRGFRAKIVPDTDEVQALDDRPDQTD